METHVIEKLYHALFAGLDAGIIDHPVDTSIISRNERAAELLGLSETKIIDVLITGLMQ